MSHASIAERPPAASLRGVAVDRSGRTILTVPTWDVRRGQRWVVLGANGCGKTTLLRLLSLYEHPSRGSIEVLGETLGRTDVRMLRRRIGFVSSAFASLLREDLAAEDVVVCALNAALEPWWHRYSDAERERARAILAAVGLGGRSHERLATLSSGERARVHLARALMCDPELLLLDEPTSGLDLVGRETLLADLDALDPGLTTVLVTHHLEEIPASFDHALLLDHGRVVAAGPIGSTLHSETLSCALGLDVVVTRTDGRWATRLRRGA